MMSKEKKSIFHSTPEEAAAAWKEAGNSGPLKELHDHLAKEAKAAWALVRPTELIEQMVRDTKRVHATLEQIQFSLQAATEWPREAVVEFPFLTVDAALGPCLDEMENFRYRRQGLSSGSARYTLRFGSETVGFITLRAVMASNTYIALEVVNLGKLTDSVQSFLLWQLPSILWAFIEGLYIDEHNMKKLAESTEQVLPTISPVLVPAPPAVPEPQILDQSIPQMPKYKIDGWDAVFNWFYAYGNPKRGMGVKRLAEEQGIPTRTLQSHKETYDAEHGTSLKKKKRR